jgi:hypothetical protein
LGDNARFESYDCRSGSDVAQGSRCVFLKDKFQHLPGWEELALLQPGRDGIPNISMIAEEEGSEQYWLTSFAFIFISEIQN